MAALTFEQRVALARAAFITYVVGAGIPSVDDPNPATTSALTLAQCERECTQAIMATWRAAEGLVN